MIEKTFKVGVDLDARQAAYFVQTANKFHSKVELSSEGKRINAKSIMGTMALGLQTGKEITISADGTDESAAIEELFKVLG